ncbi:MAG: hypothetical protein M1834_007005 [Cirrosporium novae-zelandiae]|nr:MAG: hypothetical protein M1834_007005 [Cirrosporium novae-zelandiae]
MSGIEGIAGLIIGAVPLVICTLECYKETRQTWDYMRNSDLYIDRFILELNEQMVLVEADLQVLLTAVGLGDEVDLSKSCGREVFEKNDTEEELQEYLGPIYTPYHNALFQCERIIDEFARDIGAFIPKSPDNKGNPSDLEAGSSFRQDFKFVNAIKFACKRKNFSKRMRKLESARARLQRLSVCGKALMEQPILSSSKTVVKLTSAFTRVQSHASRLYSAISRGWIASCHSAHGSSLYLESREALLQRQSKLKRLKRPTLAFKMLLSSITNLATKDTLWQETNVEVLENDNYNPPMCSKQQEPRRSVTVQLSTPRSIDSHRTEAHDLCVAIDKARQEKICLQLFLSNPANLYLSQTVVKTSASPHFVAKAPEFVTLEQAFFDAENHEALDNWTLMERLTLSFNLASSLLQLYLTPWSAEPWTKRSICFLKTFPQQSSAAVPDIFEAQNPLVTHLFNANQSSIPLMRDARRSLLELGIMLLEIWEKKTFESYAKVSQKTLDDDSTGRRSDVARLWLDNIKANVIPLYYDAVSRCIECTFATSSSSPDWDDVDFRKSVCERVLRPLWELLGNK